MARLSARHELRTRGTMWAILREQERSNSANVAFRTAPPPKHPFGQARLLGPGWFYHRPGRFFWRRRIKMEFLLGVVVGFALGYGVREAISRRRRARARRESGYQGEP
jgi:hypothetical protein